MRPLHQPDSGTHTVRYLPDAGTALLENPPRFTWMPARDGGGSYLLQVAPTPDFGAPVLDVACPYNFHTPDRPLPPGTYHWRYAFLHAGEQTEWSVTRSFTVPDGLPETPLPDRAARYRTENPPHPRLWLNPEELAAFRAAVAADPTHCEWSAFFEGSVRPWLERPLIHEPQPYPGNKRVVDLWRRMYMDCQEALYATRHLAVAAQVTQDPAIVARAKEWLLHLASWDVEGPTSRDYNDEAAFRIAGALAWGYDWLHDLLNEGEREAVRKSLTARLEQVAYHAIRRAKIHHNPYDSHAVRSVSSVLLPCCTALFGEVPEAREWLDFALEYLACIYTPWGGQDGGWAEGPHYWMTGMAYLTDALNMARKFTNVDLYRRPFFRKTGDFPLYVYPPDCARASFGDTSSLGMKPGLKVGFNIRQFAGVTGNGCYQWYYDRTRQWDVNAEQYYWNSGWWDFRFDEMLYRHDYPAVEPRSPQDLPSVKCFRDVGWVAFHHRMDDPGEHIFLLTKASPYGSISHSNGNQASFTLHAYGEPMAIQSGHYIGHGSTEHWNWRRMTRSKNGLLIGGQGQYAGKDKIACLAASGTVEAVEEREGYAYTRMNATAAYRDAVPHLTRYAREYYFVNRSYFVMVDQVELAQPAPIQWLMHTLGPVRIDDQMFRLEGGKADLDVTFIYNAAGFLRLSQTDAWPDDVEPDEMAGLPRQWHLTAATRESRRHQLVTLMVPSKKGQVKDVRFFLDDQGHGIWLYFTEGAHRFRLDLPTLY